MSWESPTMQMDPHAEAEMPRHPWEHPPETAAEAATSAPLEEQLPAGEDVTFEGQPHQPPVGPRGISPELRLRIARNSARTSMEHLARAGYMTEEVQEGLLQAYDQQVTATANEPVEDVLFFLLGRMQQSDEQQTVRMLNEWTRTLRSAVPERKVSHLPFLQHTGIPQAYKDFPAIFDVCQILCTPLVQSHDKDFLSVSSINPITASLVADAVVAIVEAATGKLPITFVLTMAGEHYQYLTRKHFGS